MKKIKILLTILGISIGLTGCSLPFAQNATTVVVSEDEKQSNNNVSSLENEATELSDEEDTQVEVELEPLTDEEIEKGYVYVADNYHRKAQIVHHTYEYYIDGQNYNIKIDKRHGCCCPCGMTRCFINGHYQHTILVEYDCLHLIDDGTAVGACYTYDGKTEYSIDSEVKWSCPNCPGKTHEDDYNNVERFQP